MCHRAKSPTLALLFPQHVIEGLFLESAASASQLYIPRFAKQRRASLLIPAWVEANPKKVGVVGRQAIGGAQEFGAGKNMTEQLAQLGVMKRIEPADGTVVQGHRPMNKCRTAIEGLR